MEISSLIKGKLGMLVKRKERKQTTNKSQPPQEPTSIFTVVKCPVCSQKLRVPTHTHIIATCPTCNADFDYPFPQNEKLLKPFKSVLSKEKQLSLFKTVKTEAPMAENLTPILQVAKEILQTAGRKGMHINDIAGVAVAQNKNMGLSTEELSKKLGNALSANLKLKNSSPTFAKVNQDKGPRKGKPKMGWYRLKQQKVVLPEKEIQVPKTEKPFLGCAGEFAVMSELLFWGYNASTMAVDDGVDIVASKDGKFFYIQVKTASCQEGNKYQFTIPQSSFKRYDTYNVFYVFVMRKEQRNYFIVLPVGSINHYINSGAISSSVSLSLCITHDDKRTKYILNGKENITSFFGNFGAIK